MFAPPSSQPGDFVQVVFGARPPVTIEDVTCEELACMQEVEAKQASSRGGRLWTDRMDSTGAELFLLKAKSAEKGDLFILFRAGDKKKQQLLQVSTKDFQSIGGEGAAVQFIKEMGAKIARGKIEDSREARYHARNQEMQNLGATLPQTLCAKAGAVKTGPATAAKKRPAAAATSADDVEDNKDGKTDITDFTDDQGDDTHIPEGSSLNKRAKTSANGDCMEDAGDDYWASLCFLSEF